MALKKHAEKAESKGVKAHFRMDEDGILHLDRVRLHCCQPYCLIKTHLYCTCTMHVLHRTPVSVDVYICQYSLCCFFSTQVEFVFEKEGDPEESTWSSEYMLVNKLGLSMCQWSNTS